MNKIRGRWMLAVTFAAGITLGAVQSEDARAQTYRIEITDHGFEPARITGIRDQKMRIEIHNAGSKVHNFELPAFYVFTANLRANERTSVEFTPDRTGTFPFFSDAGGAREPGLAGQIEVR